MHPLPGPSGGHLGNRKSAFFFRLSNSFTVQFYRALGLIVARCANEHKEWHNLVYICPRAVGCYLSLSRVQPVWEIGLHYESNHMEYIWWQLPIRNVTVISSIAQSMLVRTHVLRTNTIIGQSVPHVLSLLWLCKYLSCILNIYLVKNNLDHQALREQLLYIVQWRSVTSQRHASRDQLNSQLVVSTRIITESQ